MTTTITTTHGTFTGRTVETILHRAHGRKAAFQPTYGPHAGLVVEPAGDHSLRVLATVIDVEGVVTDDPEKLAEQAALDEVQAASPWRRPVPRAYGKAPSRGIPSRHLGVGEVGRRAGASAGGADPQDSPSMDEQAALIARQVAMAAAAWFSAPADVEAYRRLARAVGVWNAYCSPAMDSAGVEAGDAELLDELADARPPAPLGAGIAELGTVLRRRARIDLPPHPPGSNTTPGSEPPDEP